MSVGKHKDYRIMSKHQQLLEKESRDNADFFKDNKKPPYIV